MGTPRRAGLPSLASRPGMQKTAFDHGGVNTVRA